MNKMKWILLATTILSSVLAWGQRGSQDTLKSGDVVIRREYEPRVADAFKLSDNPKIQDTVINIDKNLPYEVRTKRLGTQFSPEPIKPAKMKGEPLQKLYKAYANFGIGNYLTTRGELVLNNTRSRKWDYGLTAWHHGSAGGVKDRGYSGFSDNNFRVYGKKFLYNKIISGDLKYDLNTLHRYGYDESLEDLNNSPLSKSGTAQSYQNLEPSLHFKTYFKDSSTFNYEMGVKYYHYWDKNESTEDNFLIRGAIDRYFNSEFGQVNAWVDVNTYKQVTNGATSTINSTIFGLNPSVLTGKDRWSLKIGANVTFSNGGQQNIYFYPDIYLKYDLVKDILIPYVGTNGQLKRNNYKALTQQNPFVVSNPATSMENTRFNLFGGIRGEAASHLSFNAGFSYRSVEDLALYINRLDSIGSTYYFNQFDVVTDDAKITNLFLEVGLQKTKKYSLLLKGEYWIYDMQNQKAAWHLPDFKITFNGRYNIGEKIQLTADIYYVGEREALSPIATDNKDYGNGIYGKTLDGVLDLNLGVEYYFNPRWTVYLKLYNLANSRYAYYNEYYQQGLTVLAGTTYRFWADKKSRK